MPWQLLKTATLGTVTLGSSYTAASGSMSLTAGQGARLPATGTYWISWNDSGTIHLFRVTARSTDTLTVTAEATEGAGDTNIASGQTLTAVSTISAIEMQGVKYLEEHTASTSASLDFTTWYSTAYDDYMIEFVNLIPATDAVQLRVRMSTDGGSTYDSGANYSNAEWRWASGGGGAGGGAGQTGILVPHAGDPIDNSSSAGGITGSMKLFSPGSSAITKQMTGQFRYLLSDGSTRVGVVSANSYDSTTAVNAFQVDFTSGNIASGTVRVYGLAKG